MWREVCRTNEVGVDEPMAVSVDGQEVGIFRVGEQLYAVGNVCSHEYANLTSGWITDDVVECPLHAAKFCLKTGECLEGPTIEPVLTYQVRETDGAVEIFLN